MTHSRSNDPSNKDQSSVSSGAGSQRKVLVSALATSAVITLLNWDALAHGNRSSHKSATGFAWAPDRYILMRQELEDPQSPDTRDLKELYRRIDELGQPTDPVGLDQQQRLREEIKSIEDRLRLAPLSRRAHELSVAGDVSGVAALIEGSGNAEAVLDAYNWAVLDIARRSDQGLLTTDTDLPALTTASRAAFQFAQRQYEELARYKENPDRLTLQVKIATLLHNVAAFTIPDIGATTTASLQLGRDAATLELRIRSALRQPLELIRAQLVVGQHLIRAGDAVGANSVLAEARAQADRLGHLTLGAYARVYQADAVQAQSPQFAARLRRDALRLLEPLSARQTDRGGMRPYSAQLQASTPEGRRQVQENEQLLNDAAYLRQYVSRK